MKKTVLFIFCVFSSLSYISTCFAGTYNFAPGDVDLWDLEHGYAYEWGIDFSLDPNEEILEATFSISNIRNWNNNQNDLYITLLSDATTGYNRYGDSTDDSNYWAAPNSKFLADLAHYEDMNTTPRDETIDFNQDQIDLLTLAVSNGNFGFGLDADCHFWNDGISFTLTTAYNEVPEPATMLLFGTGLVGLAGLRRKNKK